MAKDTKAGTYEPRIPPDRQLESERTADLAEQRGTYRLTRYGEQYVGTCTCLSEVITSDSSEADRFMDQHRMCGSRSRAPARGG